MTRKLEDPETKLFPCIESDAAGPDAPTRWLRVKRNAARDLRRQTQEPATRAIPKGVLANFFAAQHARPPALKVPCSTLDHSASSSAPLASRPALTERLRQTATTSGPLPRAQGSAQASSARDAQPAGPGSIKRSWRNSLPPARARTLIGCGLVAMIGALVLHTRGAPSPAAHAPAPTSTARTDKSVQTIAPAPSPALPESRVSARQVKQSETKPAALPGPVQPAPSPAAAIDRLAAGDYRQALAAYRKLAAAFPEQPAYAAVATVLQHRLATRCSQRAESGDPACAPE